MCHFLINMKPLCLGEISVDQPLLGSLLEAANWLQVKGLYENGLEQDPEQEHERSETEPSIASSEPKSPVTLDLDQYRRKRNHSEESEIRCESPESQKNSSPPTKVPRSVLGLTNTGWIMDSIKEKSSEEVKVNDIPDIPNLLNLATHQNFLQHLKTESPSKHVLEPSINEHMLQAMQLCGTSYLSQLAALQNCSQSKPLSSFTGSFTSYATSNAMSSGFKGGLLNSAPVRRYKQYSEDTLQAALKEIMEGQSINRSSMKYNIPARTLRDWMKRLNIKSVYTHHAKDKDGSIGSTSPEPEINLSLSEKFRNVAFPGLSANSSGDIDDDDTETLKIDESCQSFSSVAEMAA